MNRQVIPVLCTPLFQCVFGLFIHIFWNFSHDSDNFDTGIPSMGLNEESIQISSHMLLKSLSEVSILVFGLFIIEIHRGP